MEKNILKQIMVGLVCVAFASCADVPMPYDEPGGGGDKPISKTEVLPYSSTNFYTGWGINTLNGLDQPWSQGASYTQATGYQAWGGSSKSNKEVEGILVSPALNLKSDSNAVKFSFDYTIKYSNNVSGWQNYHKIYASYCQNIDDKTKWVEITDFTPKASTYSDWTLYTSGEIAVPSEFVNKDSVCIIFWFYAPASGSTTWEVMNFLIEDGKPGGSTPTPTPPTPGKNLITNGDFETWSGTTTCTGWQSTTSASSSGATSQSTDAHAGTYSIKLAGLSSQNKRLAYKEITLKAGTYNISFYAKSTGTKSSVNPGYVAVVDGKTSGSYVYTDYVDVEGSWTQVSKSFTLAAQTTVNLVIMNAKSPGVDVLIDDYSLTTSNGGLVDDPTPTPPVESIYSINFKTGQGDWTIDNKSLGEGITYVWAQSSSYGMRASAYAGSCIASESWLVSPQIDLSKATSATLSLVQILNQLKGGNRSDFVDVLISTDKTNWSTITISPWPEGTSWSEVTSTANLNSYAGQKIYLAFKYVSTTSIATTWEIFSLQIN